MTTIEEHLENISHYFEWWQDALAKGSYNQAETVRKHMLEPEIKKCAKAYIDDPKSEELVGKYITLIRDKKMPDLKKIIKKHPPIDENIMADPNVAVSKVEQLIQYCDTKIKMLVDSEQYKYIKNLKQIRENLLQEYTKFVLESLKSQDEKEFKNLLATYTESLKNIRAHNLLYDLENPKD